MNNQDEQVVDARGLDCPEPVVRTRRAMLDPQAGTLRVLVDNRNAVDNIVRLATSQGWQASVEGSSSQFEVLLTPGDQTTRPTITEPATVCDASARPDQPRAVVLVTSDVIGQGDELLGRLLMRSFIKTLKEAEPRPARILFLNAGVRLTTAGSELIDDLRVLERHGVELLSCGTCLDFFHLLDALQVGVKTNMQEIVNSLVGADRVIRI
jgi:selenium metabolism protein YedF